MNGVVQGFVAALNLVLQYVQEYVSILGDPASAVFGAFSEVIGDAVSVRRIAQSMHISESRPEEETRERTREERVLWVSVLAGQLKFNKETNWKSVAEDILSPPMSPAMTTDTQHPRPQQAQDLIATTPSPSPPIDRRISDEIKPSEKFLPTPTVSTDNTTARQSKATELDKAIAVLLVARGKFSMGILIPVILMLAATAAAFYDAYSRLGDRDTSLALAYCVWYSWLLILGVWGNCYAAAMNSDLARRAFSEIVHFGNERAVTVSLRDRYVNSQFWDNWAKKMSGRRESFNSDKTQSDMDNNPLTWKSWLHFCIGQFLGWCCVGVPSGAAAAIAWNTPTIGLGCRAFNVLLYGVLSFAVAYLNVLRSWLVLRDKVKKPEHSEKGYRQASTHYVSHIYWLLTFLNSMVMVLGTIFHLIGVFRTCWCDRLVWTDDTRIELNNRTHESLDHAKRYWLSTAYVSFSIVSLISLVGIVLRHNIAQTMGDWIDRCNRDEQRRREEADRLTQITRLTSGGAQIG
ncbi:hypothetical protein N656DRAFT_770401 [Canariomyces notabilis]|uniref:Uncharacterized protein n=1 Tax=Canariomyces notabilis TaxID=2074819 RepID=A0AAN6QQ35_9PEZI|nr:hypothetical protein N656DRAFT_770401 [Canariomyces arenarius]